MIEVHHRRKGSMTNLQSNDRAILDEIRALAGGLSDKRVKVIVHNVVDAVALNPQPLPPDKPRSIQEIAMDDQISRYPTEPIPPPPDLPDLYEFPAIIEPALKELPTLAPPPVEPAEPVPSERIAITSSVELTRRVVPVAIADERVSRVLNGKRYAMLGASRRVDDKERLPAHTLLAIYNYTDDKAYEVWLGGRGVDLHVLEVFATGEQPSLSDEEIERAVRLARSDQRVAASLPEEFKAMALLTSAVDPGDKHYGRRRAYVGFGPPDERMPRIRAIVDLSTEEVVAVEGTVAEREYS
jgi:hypothetical protein